MVKVRLDAEKFLWRLKKLVNNDFPHVTHAAISEEVRQLMFWITQGSSRLSLKPPIDSGDLRFNVFAIVDGKKYFLDDQLQKAYDKREAKKPIWRKNKSSQK